MRVVAMIWCWWSERNKANHGERRMSATELCATVGRHTAEWVQFFSKQKQSVQNVAAHWEPPPVNWIKINVDGAFHANTGCGGWGCIARGHNSEAIFAGAGSIVDAGAALETEAKALFEAVKITEDLGIGWPLFVTDCQVLQSAVTTSAYDYAQLGALFREIKVRLRLNFAQARVVFEGRNCNRVAHGAAELPGYNSVWLEDFPTNVTRALSGDSAGDR